MSVQVNRMRQRRKALGLSQSELAERIGTNQAQISKYETGENDPSTEVLAELARALEVQTDWLLGLSDDLIPCLHEHDLTTKERKVVSAWRHGQRLKAIRTIALDKRGGKPEKE